MCIGFYYVLMNSIGLALAAAPEPGPEPCLRYDAHSYRSTVTEGLPLVVRATVTNGCTEPVQTYYSRADTGGLLYRYSVLHAKAADGREYALSYVGGPMPSATEPPAGALRGGESVAIDIVRPLVVRRKPPAQWAGDLRDLLEFLAPGIYQGRLRAPDALGRQLESNTFEFTVAEALPSEEEARRCVKIRHVDYFEGRDVPPDLASYDGRPTQGRGDVSRFAELQRILEDYPDSPYAEWIRFWKLYHHGPVDQMLEYARTHRDFPLSDNLMLRVAEGIFNKAGKYDRASYDQVRDLTVELLRDFPDGDTRARAEALQEKLKKKP
jgi:hypothetical protein